MSGVRARSCRLVREVVRASADDRLTGLAAEIAFFGVLSVFPAVIALGAALGFLDRLVGTDTAAEAQAQVVDWLTTFLTDRASRTVDAVRHLFERTNGDLLTLAAIGALWSGSRGTTAVVRAVAAIHDIPEHRPWWRRRLVGLVVLLATIVTVAGILATFALGPLLGAGRALAEEVGAAGPFVRLWEWVRYPLGFAAAVAWATFVYQAARDDRRQWRTDLPGAVVAAFAAIFVTLGLRLYLELAGSANQLLGVLGGALIVLVWTYLLAAALLVGAEVNAVLGGDRPRPRS